MSIFSSVPLRRVGALTAGTALLLGSALLAPTAAADDDVFDVSLTYDADIVLHEDDTANMTLKIDAGDLDISSFCTKGEWDDDDVDAEEVNVSADNGVCTVSIVNGRINNSSSGSGSGLDIRHEGDEYIVESSEMTDTFSAYKKASVAVTFPGKVTEADDNAKISGNKVNWDNVVGVDSIRAVGKDSSGPGVLMWIIIGIVALAAIVGGVIAFVIVRNRKKTNPAAGYPGAAYQPGQPGYVAQPQPGQPYGGPQQPGQPSYGAPQQPGQPSYGAPQQPGQPYGGPQQPGQGQPPYNPNGQ